MCVCVRARAARAHTRKNRLRVLRPARPANTRTLCLSHSRTAWRPQDPLLTPAELQQQPRQQPRSRQASAFCPVRVAPTAVILMEGRSGPGARSQAPERHAWAMRPDRAHRASCRMSRTRREQSDRAPRGPPCCQWATEKLPPPRVSAPPQAPSSRCPCSSGRAKSHPWREPLLLLVAAPAERLGPRGTGARGDLSGPPR